MKNALVNLQCRPTSYYSLKNNLSHVPCLVVCNNRYSLLLTAVSNNRHSGTRWTSSLPSRTWLHSLVCFKAMFVLLFFLFQLLLTNVFYVFISSCCYKWNYNSIQRIAYKMLFKTPMLRSSLQEKIIFCEYFYWSRISIISR